MDYDVAIIGGGPSGSTTGAFLRKYAPELRVVILERETFPRDHVGESQLPPISRILDELGCWDKVEAAGFPIKVGATYRWGKTRELWDFDFYPPALFKDEPRPAKYEGQRKWTAFQVDRALYDEILLDHARELGCAVRQNARVVKVRRDRDQVTGLELEGGETVEARYYVDASGHSGIMRRALDIESEVPTSLQNIAIWDYWQNADWAVEIGVGGTRIQIMSLPYGWFWFIPLGPTRTSIGLVVPASYYKDCGLKPEELFAKALRDEERVAALCKNGQSEGKLMTTKDWSFVAKRHTGENWFLVGESAGFADPILSAGLSIAQVAAKEAAFTIIELIRGKVNADWLKSEYEHRQTNRVRNHIRFADYWYSANTQFADLQAFTSKIAHDNGLDLSPEKAWAWIAQGGFIDEDLTLGIAGFSIDQIKDLGDFMSEVHVEPILSSNNVFELDLTGARWQDRALYQKGRVVKGASYVRDGRILPLIGVIELVVNILQQDSKITGIFGRIQALAEKHKDDEAFMFQYILQIPQALEALITDGWVKASYDPLLPLPPTPERYTYLTWNTDQVKA